MNIAEAIAKRTRELLEQKGVTQYRLAKSMLVYQQTLSNFLHAKQKSANVKTVFQICKGLDISILEFFASPIFTDTELDID
jgi:transcriptional regulator with XRE-family HTH domain